MKEIRDDGQVNSSTTWNQNSPDNNEQNNSVSRRKSLVDKIQQGLKKFFLTKKFCVIFEKKIFRFSSYSIASI